MNVFEMVVTIVVFCVIAGVINNAIKLRMLARNNRAELLDELSRIDDLEDRLRVLEAVVTVQNYDLKRQFKDLERDD